MKIKSILLMGLVFVGGVATSACSSNSVNSNINTVLQSVGLAKAVINTDDQVVANYATYNHLLNESEKVQAVKTYTDVKTALEDVDLSSLLKYEIAKDSYATIGMPIYLKYKDQLDPVGINLFESNHKKLTTISESIENAKDKLIQDQEIKQYSDTALLLLELYVQSNK